MRRYLFIAAVLIFLFGIGGLLYLYFSEKGNAITVTQNGNPSLPISGEGNTTTTINSSTNTSSGVPTNVSARLVEITTGPVAPGEVVLDVPPANASSSPTTEVNYIDRQSGNVYSYSNGTKSITRTSNKTIPGIEQVYWLPNGNSAFVQYLSGDDLSTVNTYSLSADGSGGFFLPQDLAGLAVSSTSLLAVASGENGSVVSLENTDGTNATQAFTTPLSEISISFAGKNQYVVFTKPSATLAGDVFLVDSHGNFSRIAGPLDGLVALASPSGQWVLVSYSNGGSMAMELVNTATEQVLPLPIATIADKCVWTSDSLSIYCGIPQNPPTGYVYPDDWYQGNVSFSDRIWRIDVANRYAQLVLDFSQQVANASLDAEDLSVDASSTDLVFVNKNDGSLWSYQLQ